MMKFSMILPLLVFMLALCVVSVRRLEALGFLEAGKPKTIYGLIAALTLWGISSALFSITGLYASPLFLNYLPGLWLPLIPMVIVMGAIIARPNLANALLSVIKHTPPHHWLFFHGLRVLALGSLIKAYRGEFPSYFALLVGVPDLLFGLSAIVIGFIAHRWSFNRRLLAIWNMIGFVIILPAVPLFQMGLTGPLQVFVTQPTAMHLLEFPMVLAPTLIVPMFIMVNLLAAWHLAFPKAGAR